MSMKRCKLAMGLAALIIGGFTGGVLLPQSVSAWDPNPNRSLLGYMQQQRQTEQYNQLRNQFQLERGIRQMREQQMSRQVDRQIQALRQRQTDLQARQELNRLGTRGAMPLSSGLAPVDGRGSQTAVDGRGLAKDNPKLPAGDQAITRDDEGMAEVKSDHGNKGKPQQP